MAVQPVTAIWSPGDPFPAPELLVLGYPSAQTQATYVSDWRLFMRFMTVCFQITDPFQVTVDHVISYRDTCLTAPRRARTVNKKLSAIRAVYAQAVARGIILYNPADAVTVRRLPEPDYDETLPLSDAEIQALFTAALAGSEEVRYRDLALLVTLAHLALRASEVVGITCDRVRTMAAKDGKSTFEVIEITGKGGRSRRLPVVPVVMDAWAQYLTHDRYQPTRLRDRAQAVLFQASRSRASLSRKAVWKIVRACARRAGLPLARVHPHTFRHTAITRAKGHDIFEIMAFAGHSKPETTMRYTHERGSPENSPAHTIIYHSETE